MVKPLLNSLLNAVRLVFVEIVTCLGQGYGKIVRYLHIYSIKVSTTFIRKKLNLDRTCPAVERDLVVVKGAKKKRAAVLAVG